MGAMQHAGYIESSDMKCPRERYLRERYLIVQASLLRRLSAANSSWFTLCSLLCSSLTASVSWKQKNKYQFNDLIWPEWAAVSWPLGTGFSCLSLGAVWPTPGCLAPLQGSGSWASTLGWRCLNSLWAVQQAAKMKNNWISIQFGLILYLLCEVTWREAVVAWGGCSLTVVTELLSERFRLKQIQIV